MSETSPNCIALIPARGGSKRLPRKNIKMFHGKPLLAWAIDSAKQANVFSDIYVSTEDAEIADVAKEYGATVAMRPDELGADDVTIQTVTQNFLEGLSPTPDYACILQPTCPLRTGEDIVNALDEIMSTKASVVMSVVSYGWRPSQWVYEQEADKRVGPIRYKEQLMDVAKEKRLVCPNGSIRWVETNAFLKTPDFHPSDMVGYEMPWHRAVDIDEIEDFETASLVAWALENGFKFEAPIRKS